VELRKEACTRYDIGLTHRHMEDLEKTYRYCWINEKGKQKQALKDLFRKRILNEL
jgi:hypothetical protein